MLRDSIHRTFYSYLQPFHQDRDSSAPALDNRGHRGLPGKRPLPQTLPVRARGSLQAIGGRLPGGHQVPPTALFSFLLFLSPAFLVPGFCLFLFSLLFFCSFFCLFSLSSLFFFFFISSLFSSLFSLPRSLFSVLCSPGSLTGRPGGAGGAGTGQARGGFIIATRND
jgi:hypothetical protein